MENKMKRIVWIDGIRGAAAMGVFTHHFLLAFLQSTYSGNSVQAHISEKIEYGFAQSPISVLVNGNFWVCVFLLISGLIISQQIMQLEDREKVADICVKRYFRLMFPVLMVCFIVYIMMRLEMFQAGVLAREIDSSWLGQYYNSGQVPLKKVLMAGLAEIWLLGDGTFSGAFWMLNITFLGSYLSICMGCLYWRYNKKAVLPYLFLICVLWIVQKKYYTIFVFAAIISCIYITNKKKFKKEMWVVGLVLIAGGGVFGRLSNRSYSDQHVCAFAGKRLLRV